MVNMTLAIPKELHVKMKEYPEIKWAEVARKAFEERIKLLESEKDPWRVYAMKRWAEEGVEAHELFEF